MAARSGEAGGGGRDPRRLILVVDDEAKYADRLAQEFEEAGFVALSAHGGIEALTFSDLRPDLVVLDLMMPSPDGRGVLHMLRTRFGDFNPPVILLTGDITDRPDILARVYPGCRVLRKPCTRRDVIRLASELLHGAAAG
ncbi:MAG: response regulator [Planctomycetota bacterium]